MTMPNFLIIGAAKAGTTALYHYLKQHPQIYMSPQKDPRFFALEGESLNFQGPDNQAERKLQRNNRLPITSIEAYRLLFKEVKNEKAIGEVSPLYLYSPKASERIHHHIPNAKLIAILRNPVDRAYSNFLHLVREGREPLTDFAKALREEESRIHSNWNPFWHYKQRGFYYAQLKYYFDRFTKDQIRIYLNEDLKNNPTGLFQNIFQFLDVNETFVPDISISPNTGGIPKNELLHTMLARRNPIKTALKPFLPESWRQRLVNNLRSQNLVKPPQLLPEVREQLIQEYREDVLRLQDLIQRDLSKWLE
jgi:hypothetical protein